MGTIQIDGSTPKLTIGNATAEDATILFDGNAQDFYIALDDSADDLLIGLGSTVGTTPIIAIDENKLSTFSGAITVGVDDTGHDVKLFGATAGSFALWDESADSLLLTDSTPIKIGDSQDLTLYHDGTNSYITNAVGALKIATETSGIALTIGHTTSETTIADNATITGTTLATGGLGVVTAKDLGTGIHVRTADSSASVATAADELVLENGTSEAGCGISILSATDAEGVINFGDSGDADIGRIVYNHSNNYMYFTAGANEGLRIDATGAVTKPDQPCVMVRNGSAQNDIAINTVTKIEFDTERFDQNADFNTSTNVFTAPVTGRYLIACVVVLDQLDSAATFYRVEFTTSNYSYKHFIIDPDYFDSDQTYWSQGATIIADMDASDTLQMDFYQSGGTQQVDITNMCLLSIGLFA